MNDPWGISGPAFIGIYVVLLLVPIFVGPLVRAAANRGAGTATYDGGPPTVYELAYLAGGASRVVETVVAALVERGQLRVSSTKKLKAAGTKPAEPLECAVAEATSDAVGSTTTGIKNWVQRSEPMRSLVAGLAQRGLVMPYAGLRLSKQIVVWLYVGVLALGFARVFNGASLHRPVGFLIPLLIVAFVAAFIASRRSKRELTQPPTKAGRRMLADARASHEDSAAHQSRPSGLLLAGAAGAVALGGLAMYPDEELSSVLMTQPSTAFGGMSGGGSSGGGSSCSSGSSCGGGGGSSCGGGGCGG
ncbi:TIGR04222 domain-containing membrane protein [Amycolatopsis sp. H20-H5]|uniref:TIGR04222 domain-containing membrane protein n=1 Tax=Amycolatopsis sp. H20-H5 TaxID=3046309 RepID=UPI002DB940A6|nr:TIGR04222 domain-containing membrane protein [Amycolatopsis sp. H20-H5]MEC3981567.1 TIGR04222 domain-containing membrane protein [Amycolatopsis sp. H20-H5]